MLVSRSLSERHPIDPTYMALHKVLPIRSLDDQQPEFLGGTPFNRLSKPSAGDIIAAYAGAEPDLSTETRIKDS